MGLVGFVEVGSAGIEVAAGESSFAVAAVVAAVFVAAADAFVLASPICSFVGRDY